MHEARAKIGACVRQVELFLLAPRNGGLAQGGRTATLLQRRNNLLEVPDLAPRPGTPSVTTAVPAVKSCSIVGR
jgi:hypothetical protein